MKFNKEESKIALIGLGYVGLPLAVELSKKFLVIGFDKNKKRIDQLKNNFDISNEISQPNLKSVNIKFTTNIKDIAECNIYIITVPTPVDKHNNPNLTPILEATRAVGKLLKKQDIVIYESTVYPGLTEEVCVPELEKISKLNYNIDFYCGYSPERINPGDKNHKIKDIKKITSGSNKEVSIIVDNIYKEIITAGTYKAPSIKVAEAAKIIENIQRDVNIALINEFSMLFNKLNIDTNEVLEAAGSKWNFYPFKPGLVGGHCIGVDPYYLTHKAQEVGYHPEMILAGRKINDNMGKYVSEKALIEMNKAGINPKNSQVAILGLTFKEDCPDLRNTKVVDIIQLLSLNGCNIKVVDPIANKIEAKKKYNIDLISLNELTNIDVVVLAVSHRDFVSIGKEKWLNILNIGGLFIDIKSVYSKNYFKGTSLKYWRL